MAAHAAGKYPVSAGRVLLRGNRSWNRSRLARRTILRLALLGHDGGSSAVAAARCHRRFLLVEWRHPAGSPAASGDLRDYRIYAGAHLSDRAGNGTLAPRREFRGSVSHLLAGVRVLVRRIL